MTDEPSPTPLSDRGSPGGLRFWASMAVGATIAAYASIQFWSASSDRARSSPARYLLGAGLAHDLIWAPVAVLVVAVTAAVVPVPARRPVRIGLAFSALLVLISWPAVRGYGQRANNPSLLPLDYGRNLLLLLGLVWLIVLATVAWRVWEDRRP